MYFSPDNNAGHFLLLPTDKINNCVSSFQSTANITSCKSFTTHVGKVQLVQKQLHILDMDAI